MNLYPQCRPTTNKGKGLHTRLDNLRLDYSLALSIKGNLLSKVNIKAKKIYHLLIEPGEPVILGSAQMTQDYSIANLGRQMQ